MSLCACVCVSVFVEEEDWVSDEMMSTSSANHVYISSCFTLCEHYGMH